MKTDLLEIRSRVLAEIRSFFYAREYVEVETPIRVTTPALEEHIDAIPSQGAWLRTSPELHMKRMLCEGLERIFQVGSCFRQGERGQRHLPEYTMLEWYHVGLDSANLLDQTLELLKAVSRVRGVSPAVDLTAEPMVMTVQEAFWLWAGWDPVEAFDEDRFDLDLVEKIEPLIAEQTCPVVLKDFPVERAALARLRNQTPPVADRWELYLDGMELANAYHELTDAAEQRQRFEACAAERKQRGQDVYPLDEDFLSALELGMPDTAGIALGVDRLLMVLTQADRIDDVVAFAD